MRYSTLSRGKLLHDLAIVDYMDYYKELGFDVVGTDDNRQRNYQPDLVLRHRQTQQYVYLEFKLYRRKNDIRRFSEFKERKLNEDPNAEFYVVIVNDKRERPTIIHFPFASTLIELIIRRDYDGFWRRDNNATGVFRVVTAAVTEQFIDENIRLRGDGLIVYEINYREGRSNIFDDVELNFRYELTLNGARYFTSENKLEAVIRAQVEFDEIR